MRKKIKMIMLDIDGTLLTNDFLVTKDTLDALKKAKAMGIIVGIATGRDVVATMRNLKLWKMDGVASYIVGEGGSQIYDLEKDVITTNNQIDGDLILEIMCHYKDMDVSFSIPLDGNLYYFDKENEYLNFISNKEHLRMIKVDAKEFLKTPKPKIMIACNPSYMPKVLERSKTFSNPKFKFASLITSSFIYEYLDPNVSKSNGIKSICKTLGFSIDNVLSFGDQDNDIDMISSSGIGVAMGNGSEGAKKAADFVTLDNNHDGIAYYLNKYIF